MGESAEAVLGQQCGGGRAPVGAVAVVVAAVALPATVLSNLAFVVPALGAVIGAVGADKNYELLLYSAGVAALVGALIVLPIKKVQ